MKVLVLNCGSSSVKFLLYDMETTTKLANGLVEKIGTDEARKKFTDFKEEVAGTLEGATDHERAIHEVIDYLIEDKIISGPEEIGGVGHRVVHGGEAYKSSVLIDDDVCKVIRDLFSLAPLHNPANLTGIEVALKLLPDAPQVAVFDTAFHQSMPPEAYMYALPHAFYDKYKVRRYGFHGTSHFYVSQRVIEATEGDINNSRIITVHLGNGCSMAAVKNGKSVDTSMGLTPLEGLVMGTRSGDLDPGIVSFLIEKGELSAEPGTPDFIDTVLNKKSGLVGLSETSNDMREIMEAIENGNEKAKVAFDVTAYRLKKYIAAYAAAMGGVDYIVFTGGIGENVTAMRKAAVSGLEFMGVVLDDAKNDSVSGEACISADSSKAQIWVLPTKEELVIARDTEKVIKG